MSEAVPSSSCVLPDNFTEADGVAQPGDIMLVNSPPDDGEEISSNLMSSLKQHNEQDTNSDSGDSLFITQKCAPQRRRRSSRRSNFRDSPEHEYDASTSEEEHPEDRKQKKKSCTTPKFTFDFLKERMMTRLPYYQNRKLHYYAMGGYFRCAERLWDSYQTGEDLLESLPTADEDGEPISPMSEEEDETTENEDIRLVEKKLFVVSKTKNSQPWYNPRKGSSEETQQNEERYNAAREPQGRPGRMTLKISTGIPSSRRVSSSKTKESNEISEESESVDDRLSMSGTLPAETETGKNSRSPGKESRASGLIPEDNEQMLGNESDATCGGVSAEQSDRQATDPHTGADKQTGVQDNNIECRIIKVTKRKKKKQDREDDKCVEEGNDQSLEGAGGHQPDPSANLIITEEVEAPCMKKRKKREEEEMWLPSSRGESSSKTNESNEISEESESVDDRLSMSGSLPAETETGKNSRSPGKESRASGLIPEDNEQMLGNESDATCGGVSAELSDRQATDPHTGADEQTGVQDNDIECRIIKVTKRKKKKQDREDDKCVEEGKDQSLEGAGGHQPDPSSNLIITEEVEAPCMKKRKKREEEEMWLPSSRGESSSKTNESNEISEESESVDDRLSMSGSLPAETETGKNSRSPGKESRASGLILEDNEQMLGNESDATCGGVSAEQSDRQATDPHTGVDEQTSVQDNDIECRIIKVKKRKKKKKDRDADKCVEEGQDQSLEGAGGHQPDPSANLIITEEVEAPCMEKRKKKKKKKKREEEETWIPSSRGASSSKTNESNEVLEETKSVNDRVSTSGSLPAETETGKNSRFPGKESRASGLIPEDNEQMLGNESDATCGGVSAEQSDRQATDPHTGADEQTGVQDNDIECRIIKVKKRKKKKQDREDDKCVEEGQDQSLEGAGGHQPDPSANLIITKEVEAPCMEKRKKKKKKRENQYIRQEVDEQSVQQKEEDFVVVCENGNIVTDSLKTNKAAESATNDVHVPKKRKKKKKDYSDLDETTTEHPEAIDHSSNGEVFQETLESNGFKRKKHKKKSQSPNDNQTDVDLSNDASTWPENTDFVYKKKKKKHVNDQVGLAEEDESVEKTPKEKQDIEQETKKKKKKKMKDDISVSNSEDMLAYGDYSQLVRKKKKIHSVLSADDEEPSPSAHEGCAEKPEVSAGELAAESADDFEHLQESKDGKKKKKRSAAVPESEERELEETSEAPIKNKEKHKRTKRLTETLESVEQSQPKGAVVVKKTKKRKSRGEVPDEESHQTKEDRTNPGAGSRFNSASSKTFPAELATSSSHCMERKRKHNARKRLYNPDKDFLSDLNSSPDRS